MSDPTFDELMHSLPYLDGVVHETLRLRPPVVDHWREVRKAFPCLYCLGLRADSINQAAVDDVLPLSKPIRTRSGETVDRIHIAKGTLVTVNIEYLQRGPTLWGADADEFKPERWFNSGKGVPDGAREIQGHRHLLAFIDGPRTWVNR